MSGASPPAPRPRRVPRLRVPGLRGRGKRPSTTVMVVAAACAAIVAAVIAIDATSHRARGPAAAAQPGPGLHAAVAARRSSVAERLPRAAR